MKTTNCTIAQLHKRKVGTIKDYFCLLVYLSTCLQFDMLRARISASPKQLLTNQITQ